MEILLQCKALDKREYLVICFLISHRNHYVVTPHLNRLVETVQMRNIICFYAELTKIITKYSLLSATLCSGKIVIECVLLAMAFNVNIYIQL